MSEFERRIKELTTRLSQWWNTNAKSARQRRVHPDDLRRSAAARAQQAASRMQDFRQSERGQRAEARLKDLRTSDAAKRAETALKDLRASEAGQKAEHALSDLRQREPLRKAEESARKVLHDLFSGGGSGSSTTTGAGTPEA
jgi:hypothetical protein